MQRVIYGLAAAVCAVLIWSFKPVIATFAFHSISFAEVYLLSATLSVLFSIIVVTAKFSNTKKILSGSDSLSGISNAAIAGVFLGVWYYGFYRALYESNSVAATVVAFSWPAIAAVALQVLSKGEIKRLTAIQWFLLATTFAGVVLITLNSGSADFNNWSILWAVLAAFGSGLYLPFSVKSINNLGSTTFSSFTSISISNFSALLFVLTLTLLFNVQLNFENVTWTALLLSGLIGIGVYLIAEILWVRAVSSLKTSAVVFLPYLSPVLSAGLLITIFNEEVTLSVLCGAALVVLANIVLAASLRKEKTTTHSRNATSPDSSASQQLA